MLVSKNLGKPEKYVMVRLDPAHPMMFAGSALPCAYLELKSIGLPASGTEALSRMLCQLMLDELMIPPERVYVELADAKDSMWGWDGGTFQEFFLKEPTRSAAPSSASTACMTGTAPPIRR